MNRRAVLGLVPLMMLSACGGEEESPVVDPVRVSLAELSEAGAGTYEVEAHVVFNEYCWCPPDVDCEPCPQGLIGTVLSEQGHRLDPGEDGSWDGILDGEVVLSLVPEDGEPPQLAAGSRGRLVVELSGAVREYDGFVALRGELVSSRAIA